MRLDELGVMIFDAQTTAASPKQGRLLELAWRLGESPVESRVIRAGGAEGADVKVAGRILRMTGITPAEIEAGVSEAELFALLAPAVAGGPRIAVIHFATFEARFLEDLWRRHAGAAFPLEILCTHAVARRLFPKLPSRSLRAIAGFFGAQVEHLKRAPGHVEATAFIWTRLRQELATQGVTTLAELRAWLAQKAPRAAGPRQFPLERALRLGLPDAPGVYRLLGPSGQVLYVGKATSLRSRVNSYFRQRRGLGSPKNELLTQVVGLEATACETPLEAALLETDEIKRLAPPYNIALRERARPLGFFDRALNLVEAADPAARLGPFPTPDSLAPVTLLAAALGGGLASGLELAALFYEEVGPDVLAAGLRLFEQALPFPVDRATPRTLLAYGAILARAGHEDEDDEKDEKEAEGAEAEVVPREWTAEDVARHLTLRLAQAGRALVRSHRLAHLANATVVFQVPKKDQGWRYLTFEGGHLLAAGWTADPDAAPRARRAVKLGADGRAYDRVRVLSTELLRMSGAHVL